MNIYYVYAYISKRTGLPYYIGKGKGRRAFDKHKRNGKNFTPTDKTRILILERNLTNVGACAIERRLIRWYGKRYDNSGILLNFTDGGEDSAVFGWHHSEKSKQKMSECRKGVKMGPNSVPSPLIGVPRSEEVKKKISEKLKGRVIGDNAKKSEAAKKRKTHPWTGKKRPTKQCPHCEKVGADYLMNRWHFDNCKSIE